MKYPPLLPSVLISALSSDEGSTGRGRRGASATQTSRRGHRLKRPGTTVPTASRTPLPAETSPAASAGLTPTASLSSPGTRQSAPATP